MARKSVLFFVFILFLISIGCGAQDINDARFISSNSQPSVYIPTTPIRNQGRFGICWAYGTIGLIESHYKTQTGREIALSAEALAFYHMAEGIKLLLETETLPDLLSIVSRNALPEGWIARKNQALTEYTPPGTTEQHDGLDLAKIYGVVPETVWSFKINTFEEKANLFRGISENIRAYISGRILSTITIDEVMDHMLVGPNAFPSRPPKEFFYEGKTYSSQERAAPSGSNNFLKDYLTFDPDQFVALHAEGEKDYDMIVNATKRALARGLTVPFAYPINIDRLHGDLFTGKDVLDRNMWVDFALDGGHLVIVTDFVNIGGKEGQLPEADLKIEVEKPASNLDYLIIKNSWGQGTKYSETGTAIAHSPNGFYKIDQSYLRGAVRVPEQTYSKWNTLVTVVPKEVTLNLPSTH